MLEDFIYYFYVRVDPNLLEMLAQGQSLEINLNPPLMGFVTHQIPVPSSSQCSSTISPSTTFSQD